MKIGYEFFSSKKLYFTEIFLGRAFYRLLCDGKAAGITSTTSFERQERHELKEGMEYKR